MGQSDDLGRHAAPPCLDHPPLGFGQTLPTQVVELIEAAFQSLQARLKVRSGRTQRRTALVGRRRAGALGIPQEVFAAERISFQSAVTRDECFGLAGRKPMTLGRLGERHLLACRGNGAERQRHGQGQASLVQANFERRCQAPRQEQPALDPPLLTADGLADGQERQPILVRKRCHDACLVHGTRSSPRIIGLKDPGFQGRSSQGLDDDRNLVPIL
jgi:hypothetical protein